MAVYVVTNLVLDSILAFLALYSASYIVFSSFTGSISMPALASILILPSFLLKLLYDELNNHGKDVIIRISISIIVSYIFYQLVVKVGGYSNNKEIFFISAFIFYAFQYPFFLGIKKIHAMATMPSNILILGQGQFAHEIRDLLVQNRRYNLVGLVNCNQETDSNSYTVKELQEKIKSKKIHKLVVSLSERRGRLPVKELLSCKFEGIEVVDAPKFYEQLTGKLFLENITPSWFIFSAGFKVTTWRKLCKRALDLTLTIFGLIVSAPLFPILALAIKLDSPGSVFYKQERVGQKQSVFSVYKFRTMKQNAEKMSGAVWAQEDDPRITRVGKILRKSRLDELPQLFNILKGDMSLVGPRPERPEFVQQLQQKVPYYSERHYVKPGLTGWAQVSYPYGSSDKDALEKLRFDLYYLKNLTILFDIKVILKTISVVLFGSGAR